MGNCYSESECEHCDICHASVDEKYIVCTHCSRHFHYNCLLHTSPALERCICGRHTIQFVNVNMKFR